MTHEPDVAALRHRAGPARTPELGEDREQPVGGEDGDLLEVDGVVDPALGLVLDRDLLVGEPSRDARGGRALA